MRNKSAYKPNIIQIELVQGCNRSYSFSGEPLDTIGRKD